MRLCFAPSAVSGPLTSEGDVISDSIPGQTPQPEPANGPSTTTRSRRPRWFVPAIGAVVLLAVVIGIVLGLTINGNRSGGSAAAAAGFVPADASFYYEVRLDLTANQQASLKTLLGHFPGEIDHKLTDELDQQLDTLLAKASPSGFTYTRDVKPWFDGSLAVAMVGYPSMSAAASADVAGAMPKVLAFAGVKDQDAANAFSDRLRAALQQSGASVSSAAHGSATIWKLAGSSTAAAEAFGAWTVTAGEVIIGSNADLVAGALDTKSGGASLATQAAFQAALAKLPSDRVLTFTLNPAPMVAEIKKALTTLQPSFAGVADEITALYPTYMAGSAQIQGDRLVFDGTLSMPSGAPLPVNGDRGLAALAPGDAIFFDDGSQVGEALARWAKIGADAVRAYPGAADQLGQAEAVLGGELPSLVSWIGDAALVAGDTNNEPYAGLIITPTDAAAARKTLGQLRGLLQLAAGGGVQLSITDADHNGTTITTIKAADSPDGAPAWATSYQYAVTDSHVIFGSGSTFVGRVLDMDQAHSLAGQSRFNAGLTSVGGSSNSGTLWLDTAALRAAIEPVIPGGMSAEYTRNVQPWLTPLDYLIGSNRVDGQDLVSKLAIVVK